MSFYEILCVVFEKASGVQKLTALGYKNVVVALPFLIFGLGTALFLLCSKTVLSNVASFFIFSRFLRKAERMRLKKTGFFQCHHLVRMSLLGML